MNKKLLSLVVMVTLLAGVTVAFAAKSNVGEVHKSEVANVVDKIDKIANEDPTIGEEIKKVATEEKATSESISEKIKTVEQRSGFKTFFIGSDYKNLGALRSELETTQNHIDRLTKALDRTTSTTTKAELEAQIKTLSDLKTKAETFVKNNESKFSLFGWVVKLFQ